MNCPVCNSNNVQKIKSKGKKTREILFKCLDCGITFRETIKRDEYQDVRVIVSEYEKTHKHFLKLPADQILETGMILEVDNRKVEITSLETKNGGRRFKSSLNETETIWAAAIDIPVRVGISVDFGGRIFSQKVEVDQDFEFTIGDVVRLGSLAFQIYSLKTLERKLRRGFAKASVTKRVYGKPVEKFTRFDYDLTSKVVG